MKIAMTRSMDSQGRIVIPAEIRKTMNIRDGEPMEIEPVKQGILLRKYHAFVPNDQEILSFLEILYSVVSCGTFVCTRDAVIASKGVYLPEGSPISEELSGCISAGKEKIFSLEPPVYVLPHIKEPVAALFPIHTADPLIPELALAVLTKRQKPLSDMELGSAKLVAATLAHHLI